MIVTLWICFAALVIGMGLVLIRLEIGPTNLDRAVALDVITASAVGIVVVLMALTGRVDLLPLLVVLTSVGFIGSTTIARFSQAESISDRRVLTAEEAARAARPQLADDDASVHPDVSDDEDDPDAPIGAGFDLEGETR